MDLLGEIKGDEVLRNLNDFEIAEFTAESSLLINDGRIIGIGEEEEHGRNSNN